MDRENRIRFRRRNQTNLTLGMMLRMALAVRPSAPLLMWAPGDGLDCIFTVADFYARALTWSRHLYANNVRKGDRVLIRLPNEPDFLFAWTACTLMGAIAVPINPALTIDEISNATNAVFPRIIVSNSPLKSCPRSARRVAVPCLFTDAIDLSAYDGVQINYRTTVRGDDTAALFFSSGSTGSPKAVAYSHANLCWGAQSSARHARLTAGDVGLICLPLHHVNALMYSFLASLWAGASVVLLPSFSVSRFWDAATRFECTWASLVQFVAHALKGYEVPNHNLTRICWGRNDPEINEVLRTPTIPWYGMTETVSHPIVGSFESPNPPGTMGRDACEHEIQLVGEGGDPIRAAGEVGRLMLRGIRGLTLCEGYYGDSDADLVAFSREGWFDTGDLAYRNNEGAFFFSGRTSDVIRVAGENVNAGEVERVIEGISGIQEVIVVPLADELFGQIPIAVIVAPRVPLVEAATLIFAECRNRLAAFKHPHRIVFVNVLPRTGTNKISRTQVTKILESGRLAELCPLGEFDVSSIANANPSISTSKLNC